MRHQRFSCWFAKMLFGAFLATHAFAAQTLVPVNATWRYLDTGTNLGTTWRAPEFNDSAWLSGPAQLGFGDGDEATVIRGGPSNNRHRTTYFRRAITITNRAALTNFAANLLRDDGAVVYVNGVEAFRHNMPVGAIVSSTFARVGLEAPEENTFYTEPLDPDLFLEGTNGIAVEVHQATAGSSDLSFAMELLANTPLGNFPPTVTLIQPLAGATFRPGDVVVVRASASDPDSVVQSIAILRNGVVVAAGPGNAIAYTNTLAAPGTYSFFARAADGHGSTGYSATNVVAVQARGQRLVHFPSFTTETNLVLQNEAAVSEGRLRLNPPGGGSGGAFVPVKQFIRDGFETTFQYDIHGIVNGGGDGFAFVIQNNPFLLAGGGGGAMGFGGIPNSLAVTFDTWGNPEDSDPSSNHIGIHTRGTLANSPNHAYAIGVVTAAASLNGVHTVRIRYTPPVLSVFLDNLSAPVLSVTNDLAALFPLDFGRAWMGLTSATGAGIESHDILSWSIATTEWVDVAITNPPARAVVNAPVSMPIAASAIAATGYVARVEFYDDGVWFGEAFAPPYQVTWATARRGWHSLVAVAFDDSGRSTASEPSVVFVQEGDGRTTLVPPGSVWRYFDRGIDPGTSWREINFQDTTWRLGPAQLGFGDDDEVTRINGGPSDDRHPTTYFRHVFAVTNAAAFSNLAVRLMRDDAGIVYLNGTEVFRSNLPPGPIGYTTLSTTAAQGANETNFFSAAVNPALLVEGANTLAVEIHQSDNASSDLGFDLELLANSPLGNQPPVLKLIGPTNGQAFPPGATFSIDVSALDADGQITALEVFVNGALRTNTAAASATITFSNVPFGIHVITARAADNSGLSGQLAPIAFAVAPPESDLLTLNAFAFGAPLLLQGAGAYSSGLLRLTESVPGATGGASWSRRAFVTNGFETLIAFRISEVTGEGADGLAFVLYGGELPTLGMGGGELGYGGTSNTLAIEFDTYTTGGSGAYHEVAAHSGGVGENRARDAQRLARTTSVPPFADGGEHLAKIVYQPGLLRVFIDNFATPLLSVPVQLGNLLALPGGTAWIGITATTGQHTEAHDLLRWQFVANGAPEIVLATPALLPDGRARLRFNTQPGRRYLVQFSPDLAGWFDAGSAFTADEPISEWIDPGPPLTPTSPGITPQRFYRVRRQ